MNKLAKWINIIFHTLVLMASIWVLAGCATGDYHHLQGTNEIRELYQKGQRLYEQKRYDAAKTYFRQIVDNHQESVLFALAMDSLASCYEKKKEYQEAISVYQQLIDRNYSGFWVDSAKRKIEEIESIQKK